MRICMCCKQSHIKHTFSFYCRFCYIYLQQRYAISVTDYIVYFETMYDKIVHVQDCSYNSLHKIHNRFQCYLLVTDKPLAELLETILVLKVNALNCKLQFFIF